MKSVFDKLNGRPGASNHELALCQAELGKRLPDDFVEFLMAADGGEGFIGQEYIILWGANELAEMNRAYQVDEYAPGFLLFGSDGGGEAYGFDTRDEAWRVVQIPFVGMDWSLARELAQSFLEFIEYLGKQV